MARVVFSGLDIRSASQLSGLLAFEGHRVRRLHHLVPVSELPLHRCVAGWVVFILFHGAFRAVLILRDCHN